MHKQSLSIPLAQQSVNETQLSTDLNISDGITDDTALTLIHTSSLPQNYQSFPFDNRNPNIASMQIVKI